MANGDDTGGGGDQPTIGGSLDSLATSMTEMLKLTRSMEEAATKTSENTRDGLKGSKAGRSIYKLTDQVPIVGKVMRTVGKQITQTFKETFKLQEAALARGMSFGELREKTSPLTDSLGELTGSFEAYQIASEMYFAGLRGNNEAMGELALSTRLTGGNWKKLVQELGQNTAGMGMSKEAMTSLAKRTLSLSQRFHITTGELVTAMKGLGSDLNELATLGLGADMQEATASLAAALEPGMTDLAPDIMKALTSGGTMIQNSMLGGGKEVADLVRAGFGDKSEQVLEAILKMGPEAQRISDTYTKGAMHSRFAMDRAIDVYGKHMPLYARAYKQLKAAADQHDMGIREYVKSVAKNKDVHKKFAETWENFKFKVLSPLKEWVMEVAEVFFTFLNKFGPQLVFFGKAAMLFTAAVGMKLVLKQLILMKTAAMAILGLGKGGGFFSLLGGHGGGAAAASFGTTADKLATPTKGKVPGAAGGGLGGWLGGLGDGLQKMGGGIKGAQTIFILGASLLPLAGAMMMIDSVTNKGEAFVTLAAGLILLGVAASFIGAGSPAIMMGAGAIAILSLALLPLAWAIQIASEPLAKLVDSLKGLTSENALGIVAVGGALLMLGPALLAFGIGGIVGALGLSLITERINKLSKASSGVATIVENFEKMGKVSSEVYTMGESINTLRASIKGLVELSGLEILTKQITKLSKSSSGLAPLGDSFDKIGRASSGISTLRKNIKDLVELLGSLGLSGLKILTKQITKLSNSSSVLATFGENIKGLVGSLGLSGLEIFTKQITKLINVSSSIPTIGENIKGLVGSLGSLGSSGLEILTKQITKLLNASSGLATIGNSFANMGTGLDLFKTSLDNFTSKDMDKVELVGATANAAIGSSNERAKKELSATNTSFNIHMDLLKKSLAQLEDISEYTENTAVGTRSTTAAVVSLKDSGGVGRSGLR